MKYKQQSEIQIECDENCVNRLFFGELTRRVWITSIDFGLNTRRIYEYGIEEILDDHHRVIKLKMPKV